MDLVELINGKKTYLVALSSLIALAIGYAEGKVTEQAAISQAVGLLLAMTIRHGVTNEAERVAAQHRSKAAEDGIRITLKEKGK
jgi:membrane protein implicated in regulation of membrane protease activity